MGVELLPVAGFELLALMGVLLLLLLCVVPMYPVPPPENDDVPTPFRVPGLGGLVNLLATLFAVGPLKPLTE